MFPFSRYKRLKSGLLKPQPGTLINKYDPLASGLQTFYGFLEQNGNIFADSTGINPSAKSSTAAQNGWAAGKFGQAAFTWGNNVSFIDCGNICDNLPNWTISFWLEQNSSTGGAANDIIVGKFGTGGFSSGQGYGVVIDSPNGHIGGINQTLGGTVFNEKDDAVATAPSSWAHIVVTSSNYVITNIYRNGVNRATTTISGGAVVTTTNTASLTIGGYAAGAFNDGFIDLVGVWNRVLTAVEVQRLFVDPLGLYKKAALPLIFKPAISIPAISGNLVEQSDAIGATSLSTDRLSASLIESGDTIGASVFQGSNVNNASGNLIESTDPIGAVVFSPVLTSGNLAEKSDTIGSKVTLPTPQSLIAIKRKTLYVKPSPGAVINAADSITSGLVFAAPFNEGGGTLIHDLITGQANTSAQSLNIWVPTDRGMAPSNQLGGYMWSGASEVSKRLTDLELTGNGSMSVTFRFLFDSALLGADTVFMGKGDGAGGNPIGGTGPGVTNGWLITCDQDHSTMSGIDYSYVTSPISYSPNSVSGLNAIKIEFECNQWNKMGGFYLPATADNLMHTVTICTAGGMTTAAQEIDDFTVYYDGQKINRLTSIGNSGIALSRYFYCASGTQLTLSDSGYEFCLGKLPTTHADGVQGILDNVLIHNRVLSSQEALRLAIDPFCYLTRPAKRIVTPVLPKLISKRFPFPFMKAV